MINGYLRKYNADESQNPVIKNKNSCDRMLFNHDNKATEKVLLISFARIVGFTIFLVAVFCLLARASDVLYASDVGGKMRIVELKVLPYLGISHNSQKLANQAVPSISRKLRYCMIV